MHPLPSVDAKKMPEPIDIKEYTTFHASRPYMHSQLIIIMLYLSRNDYQKQIRNLKLKWSEWPKETFISWFTARSVYTFLIAVTLILSLRPNLFLSHT